MVFDLKNAKKMSRCFDKKKMSRCLSFTASRDWLFRQRFCRAGLRAVSTDLGEGTVMHCWVPRAPEGTKPNLVLIHGFGANAMWQYGEHLHHFTGGFNVYVPDLVFFGRSWTGRGERGEWFQAQCVMRMMQTHGVTRASLIGISYGGFVGYSMAAQFPEAVERVALCCAGVCLEEKDMAEGLFRVSDLDQAASILMPQTPHKLRELMRFSFFHPPVTATAVVPSFILSDFIQVMCTDYVEEKRQLIHAVFRGRKLSNLPNITQPTLIIWGEQDQIFPLELGQRLKRHLGDKAELVVIKNAGHAVNMEKAKEFVNHLKSFLLGSQSHASPPGLLQSVNDLKYPRQKT